MGLVALILTGLGLMMPRQAAGEDQAEAATRRGLAYLNDQVPRWSRENGCFSCHNNGDATRALLLDPATPPESLRDTLAWLRRPNEWAQASAESPSRDDRLARLQFTLALQAATDAGRIVDRIPLARAAAMLAADQAADGLWPIDEASPVGSPATYGRGLATALARQILAISGEDRFRPAVVRADAWLAGRAIANVPDAAAFLIARTEDGEGRASAVTLLRRAQGDDGGWGPYPHAPPESFDTALALIGLQAVRDREPVDDAIRRGRQALVATQEPDGSWPATTRPAGGLSYAQKVSTTGWAAIALQLTRDRVSVLVPER